MFNFQDVETEIGLLAEECGTEDCKFRKLPEVSGDMLSYTLYHHNRIVMTALYTNFPSRCRFHFTSDPTLNFYSDMIRDQISLLQKQLAISVRLLLILTLHLLSIILFRVFNYYSEK